jgi:DNA-binding NarL/FixJ family response regulator
MTAPARILLVDDHPIVLHGLRELLCRMDGVEIVAEAENGLRALDLVRDVSPDIVVLDISMPGLNGISLARRILAEFSPVRVIILTGYEDRAYVNQAMQIGVHAYVLKRSMTDRIAQAVRAVRRDEVYFDPALGAQLMRATAARSARREEISFSALTARESEVLRLTARGLTNKEIAADLQVSIKSVETFKARGTLKLGLKSRAEIVRYAANQGWFDDLGRTT